MKDVLKYSLKEYGVLFVMIRLMILMLQSCVDKSDYLVVSESNV